MKKILIIDDDSVFRVMTRAALSDQGYATLEASGGSEGLKLARAELPDLVLSDVNMLGMDGFEVLRNLRSEPATSSIPVILMTSAPEENSIRSSMERGADDYLTKPFAVSALRAAVQARLERRGEIEAQVKASEARLLEILSATHDLIAIITPEEEAFLYLNPAGRSVLGLGPEEDLSGLRLKDFLAGEADGGERREGMSRMKQEGNWVGESTFVSRTGRKTPVSEQVLAHRSSDHGAACWSVIARDISERKRSEAELEQAHAELVEASRHAGMAEVASGVLHNIGNVLNSVNVASSVIAESLRKSKAANLPKLAALLQAHEANLGEFLTHDARGKRVVEYLAQLSEHLVREQEMVLQELGQLEKGLEHVKQIVKAQQSCSKVTGDPETVLVSDLVEDALQMNSTARGNIRVVRELEPGLEVTVEKHKVLQILVNLVRNARQACEGTREESKSLTIRTSGGDGSVLIAVTDNGAGIEPRNLERLFTRGFTTKKDGHGFGLHTSAAAAKELGGRLRAHSDGPGRGATFTVELPARPATSGGKS